MSYLCKVTWVGEERAKLPAIVFLLLCGICLEELPISLFA